MSASLVKTVDSSIFPASLLIFSKVFGIWFAIKFFIDKWWMNFVGNSFFSVSVVVLEKDIRFVSSLSDLIMLTVMLTFLTMNVVRAVYFHNTHIDPRMVARLVNLNILNIVRNSDKIYYQCFVWLVFNTLALAFVFYNASIQKTNVIIPILGFGILIANVVALVRDVEFEIERSKKELSF